MPRTLEEIQADLGRISEELVDIRVQHVLMTASGSGQASRIGMSKRGAVQHMATIAGIFGPETTLMASVQLAVDQAQREEGGKELLRKVLVDRAAMLPEGSAGRGLIEVVVKGLDENIVPDVAGADGEIETDSLTAAERKELAEMMVKMNEEFADRCRSRFGDRARIQINRRQFDAADVAATMCAGIVEPKEGYRGN